MSHLKNIEKHIAGGMVFFSALFLAVIVMLFVFEIFMRYVMHAPTKWSHDFIGFMMPVMIFFALPEITRRNQHIVITFVIDSLPPQKYKIWQRIIAAISAGTCAFAGWIMTVVALRQFSAGIMTNTVIPFPKWVILSCMAFSFFVVAMVFVITAIVGRDV